MREADWLPPQPASEPVAPPPAAPYEQPRRPLLKRITGPIVAALVVVAKAGKFIFLGLKGFKLFATSASMLVSIAAYALIWGWGFGAGFVALLFVHEMGHYIQLRREGIRPSGMVFIPFMGAVVGARSLGGNALAEARVGLAGPILGTVGTLIVAGAAAATGSDMLRALAFMGFFLNLFNLAPVTPLDGGRAMAAMAPWLWFAGLGVVALLAFLAPNPILILILVLGAMDTYRRWTTRHQGMEGNAEYYRVPRAARLAVGATYIGLIVLLALGMHETHLVRTLNDV